MEVRNTQILNTSIKENSADNGDPTPTFSKVIRQELSDDSSANIYSRCCLKFTCDAVVTESPNFMNLGLLPVHTSDEIKSLSIPATIIGRSTDGSNWFLPGHLIGEVIAARMIRTRPEQKYSSKNDFETRRENQYFERQNISMSRPPLDSNPFGINTTNGATSPIDSIPVGTETPEPTP